MKSALFYILPEQTEPQSNWPDRLAYACQQAAQLYQQGRRVYIHCQDQAMAFEVDECLWQLEPHSFIPHNLVGEGPRGGSPVEIGFQRPATRRPALINLAETAPEFAVDFTQVVDFVPTDETEKQQARERYKRYRSLGFALNTQAAGKL